MALLQKKLRTDLPYGKVYQGTGETDPKDKDCKFFQHGLYFDAKGDLLENSVHNAERIALIRQMEGNNALQPKEPVQEELSPVINPEMVAQLEGMSDEDLFAVASNLVHALQSATPAVDFGEYAPTAEKRDENIRFVAKYATA